MILLVLSQDHREYLWKPWYKRFKKSGWDAEPIIVTETVKPKIPVGNIQTGKQEHFTDSLKGVLKSLNCKYLWCTLDDYMIIEPIDFKKYTQQAVAKKADALRVQPNVQHNSLPYRFDRDGKLLRQRKDSEYEITFQTSIWRREFFIECLTDGQSPWESEQSQLNMDHKIYFAPRLPFWYKDTVRRGKLTDEGKRLISDN